MLGMGMSLTACAMRGTRSEEARPVVSVTSGAGYAGSVYTAAAAGQWYADDVAISGQNAATWTMSAPYEGARIRCAGSNVIQMWTPARLATLKANHVAGMGETLASGRVSRWSPRAGVGDATEASASAQPTTGGTINGLPALVFAAGGRMSLPVEAATTVGLATFYVAEVTGGTGARVLQGISSGNRFDFEINDAGTASTPGLGIAAGSIPVDTPRVVGWGVIGATGWALNAANRYTGAAVSIVPGQPAIASYAGGTAASWVGKIGERICLVGVTAQDDLDRCEAYLALKWATPLRTANPYQTALSMRVN